MGLKCPHCSVITSLMPVTISNGLYSIEVITDGDEKNDKIRYGIYVCQDCGRQFIAKGIYERRQSGRWTLEWEPIYPIASRNISIEIPKIIEAQFREAALCLSVRAYLACTFMCQRVLESICQDKNIANLNDLLSNGLISQMLFDRATEIRLWAGITKHKPLSESVVREDAEELLNYLDSILITIYVEPIKYDNLKKKRQQIKNP
jgi:hypothetical protein